MENIGIEAILILVLVIANGLFSMSEIAVVAARKSSLQQKVYQGSRRALEIHNISGEYEENFATVGGLIMTHLGRVPSEGDKVDMRVLRLEVMDMHGNRVDKVLITRTESASESDS